MTNKPNKDQLIPYIGNKKEAAIFFNVHERTISRWMSSYGLEHKIKNFGPFKLKNLATTIRSEYQNGKSVKELALKYNVTFSSISRLVDNITYKCNQDETADVIVVYNPIN